MRRLAVLSLLSALTACTSAPADPGTDAGPPPVDAPPIRADAPDLVTHTVSIEELAVVRDREATVCLDVPVELAEASLLVGIRTHLTSGSHHLIVSHTASPSTTGTPVACSPFSHGLSNTLFIAQQAEGRFDYPPGTGVVMLPGEGVGLEMHFINYVSDGPIDIRGTVELDFVPRPPTFREVHIAFTGNLSLTLPPHATTTETFDYSPGAGAEILAITSHTHQLGILATIDHVTPDASTRLHESTSWSDPPLTVFESPLLIDAGSTLHLECTYDNTTDSTVYFGENFEAEMCFLWAYYLDPV